MDNEINNMIENFEKKTNTKIDDWKKIISTSGFTKHGEIVNYLKSEHGLTHGYANMVVHVVKDSSSASVDNKDELIDKQYKEKENLRPIYNKLIELFQSFGNDVEIAPKLTYVSLRKKTQFAIIQPSTKTRIDIGLKLKGKIPEGKLVDSGNFNAMVTHKISLTSIDEIDEKFMNWIKEAYDKN